MAGDPFRDAWRTRLRFHIENQSIAWPFRDDENTGDSPDASAGFITMTFEGGGPEEPISWGSPRANLHNEIGQVTINVKMPLAAPGDPLPRDRQEAYAAALREAFRSDHIPFGERGIRVTGTSPLSSGFDEGGLWVVSVLLSYLTVNLG